MDTEKIIREYLEKVIHLSLATCKDKRPWVCEVHFAFDDSLNLYFASDSERRHSLEIEENPNVAGNIIAQHIAGEKVRGIYFEGKAEEFNEMTEKHPAYLSYCERMGASSEILDWQFYKIAVSDFYIFDNQENTPGKKYHLPWTK